MKERIVEKIRKEMKAEQNRHVKYGLLKALTIVIREAERK